jgi:hypothetical protein
VRWSYKAELLTSNAISFWCQQQFGGLRQGGNRVAPVYHLPSKGSLRLPIPAAVITDCMLRPFQIKGFYHAESTKKRIYRRIGCG